MNNRLRSTSLTLDEKRELLNKVCARKSVKDFEKTRTQKVNPAGKTARKNELVFVLVLRAKALNYDLERSLGQLNIQ